jgi:biopolymer transport protein ExbD
MRTLINSALMTMLLLCATVALAAEKAEVTVPFTFNAQHQNFPAGTYLVTIDPHQNVLTLSSKTDTKLSARWITGPADANPQNEKLTLKFDDSASHHTLRTIQLGNRITSRLDASPRIAVNGIAEKPKGQ